MKVSTLSLQVLFVVVFLLMTVGVQCILFLPNSAGLFDAVYSHKWMWIGYFFASLGVTEWIRKRFLRE